MRLIRWIIRRLRRRFLGARIALLDWRIDRLIDRLERLSARYEGLKQ